MTTRWKPHHYQEKAVRFLLERGAAGLFLHPGLGKSAITLMALTVLMQKGLSRGALIVAPLRVCYSTWPTEVLKWAEFNHLSVGVLHGRHKDSVLKAKHDIYLINPEGLPWLFKHLNHHAMPFDTLVIDESSKFKNTATQRFKLLKPWLPRFARRYILTGSPAPNGLLDLFGQCYVMDCGAALGTYITHYRNTYFYPSGYQGYDWKLKPGAADQIYEALGSKVLQMSAEDYLELPPLVERTIEVELPPDAMRKYKEMESVLRTELASGSVTAVNAAVAAMKCRQLANGGIYLDGPKRTWEHVHEAKTEAVVDLIEELSGQPALIAYDFQHDLERLQRALPVDTPYIGSGVSAGRSQELVHSWNRGELPTLLGHPQSMAHGLNMQEAGRAVIWHSLSWSLEDYEQFIKRVWRQGQKETVFVYHIIAKGTIDEAIMAAIKEKDTSQRALLKALSAYWEK